MLRHLMLYALMTLLLASACRRHQCPAYASVKKKEKRMLHYPHKKRDNRKDEGVFTKKQLQTIRNRTAKPVKKKT